MSCAKVAEPIESLGCWVGWVQGTCTTWGINAPREGALSDYLADSKNCKA